MKYNKIISSIIFIGSFFSLVSCQSETNSSTQQTSQSQTTDAAISEWEVQKYSMFIHFGVYSELGGG